jgi:hypothetical protein
MRRRLKKNQRLQPKFVCLKFISKKKVQRLCQKFVCSKKSSKAAGKSSMEKMPFVFARGTDKKSNRQKNLITNETTEGCYSTTKHPYLITDER